MSRAPHGPLPPPIGCPSIFDDAEFAKYDALADETGGSASAAAFAAAPSAEGAAGAAPAAGEGAAAVAATGAARSISRHGPQDAAVAGLSAPSHASRAESERHRTSGTRAHGSADPETARPALPRPSAASASVKPPLSDIEGGSTERLPLLDRRQARFGGL